MYWVVMYTVNTYRVEVKTNHATVIKYATYWKNCRNLLHLLCHLHQYCMLVKWRADLPFCSMGISENWQSQISPSGEIALYLTNTSQTNIRINCNTKFHSVRVLVLLSICGGFLFRLWLEPVLALCLKSAAP
jgi:hypothetical protein